MKVLFIGGTGNISTAASRLCIEKGIDLYLLNRGTRKKAIQGAKIITADVTNEADIINALKNHTWDVVVDWIAFKERDVERDYGLFRNKTAQYIFISSASAYQKPPSHPVITESTPLKNPFWDYSRNKIACEVRLNQLYRDEDFPATIIRPSLTYDKVIPVPIGGWNEYTVVDRIKKGMKIIVHGDGTSLWTITHARDFSNGFYGLLGNQQAVGEAIHITSDEILTWDQIYESLAAAVDMEPNIIHIPSDFIGKYDQRLRSSLLGDKAVSVIFDNSKIKKLVPGYNAGIDFRTGIKETINWFEADPGRQIINQETNNLIDKIISGYGH